MRKLLSYTVLAVTCAAGVPSASAAQAGPAELAPPQAAVPAFPGLEAPASVQPDLFSAAARETFRAPRRSPLLLPAVGALVGAAGLSGWIVYECSQSGDCIFDPFVPALVGAGAGAVVGGVIEVGLRVAGR